MSGVYVLAMAKLGLFLDRRPSSLAFVPKKDEQLYIFHDFLSHLIFDRFVFSSILKSMNNSFRFLFDLKKF